MNNPCELCPVKNTCGHAGGKPDKHQCGQLWEFNLIAASDKWWIGQIEQGIARCLVTADGGDCEHYPTCGEDLCGATCGWWQQLKREVGQ